MFEALHRPLRDIWMKHLVFQSFLQNHPAFRREAGQDGVRGAVPPAAGYPAQRRFLTMPYLTRPSSLHFAEKQAKAAREAQYQLLRDIRPNAVALVDGFGFEDYMLNSALGRKDGDVYRCAENTSCACACLLIEIFRLVMRSRP